MSIINDALKKVQHSLQQPVTSPKEDQTVHRARQKATPRAAKSPSAGKPRPDTPASPQRSKVLPRPSSRRRQHSTAFLAIMFTGTVVVLLITILLTKQPVTVVLQQPVAHSPAPPPTQSASAVRPLTAQGIMKVDGKHMALINDTIYEEGDVLDGKRVSQITIDTVTLTGGKETITLKVRK